MDKIIIKREAIFKIELNEKRITNIFTFSFGRKNIFSKKEKLVILHNDIFLLKTIFSLEKFISKYSKEYVIEDEKIYLKPHIRISFQNGSIENFYFETNDIMHTFVENNFLNSSNSIIF